MKKELVKEIFKESVEYYNSGLKKKLGYCETIEIIDWKQYITEKNEIPKEELFYKLGRGYNGIVTRADEAKLRSGKTVAIVGRIKTDSHTRSYYNIIEDVTDGNSWNDSFLNVFEVMGFNMTLLF